MVINKLKPEMVVYDVKRATGRNIWNGKWRTWTVKIIEIDAENEKVYASWNSNKPEWYMKHIWSKWRIKRPE